MLRTEEKIKPERERERAELCNLNRRWMYAAGASAPARLRNQKKKSSKKK